MRAAASIIVDVRQLELNRQSVDDLYLQIVPGCAHEQKAHGG